MLASCSSAGDLRVCNFSNRFVSSLDRKDTFLLTCGPEETGSAYEFLSDKSKISDSGSIVEASLVLRSKAFETKGAEVFVSLEREADGLVLSSGLNGPDTIPLVICKESLPIDIGRVELEST